MLTLLLTSCSSIEMFYLGKRFQRPAFRKSNCRELEVDIPKNVQIRKSFIAKQVLKPSISRHQLTFELKDPVDMKRRMLLNVRQASNEKIRRLKVWANGLQVNSFLADSILLARDVPDMVVDLCPYLKLGLNQLEIEVQGTGDSSAELFVDGFMMPVDVPGALHSLNGGFASVVLPDTRKDFFYPKFLEGMKIRYDGSKPWPDQISEVSGISLFPLKVFMKKFRVRSMQPGYGSTPEEEDQRELERQADGDEVPNRNTMYNMLFEPRSEVELQTMYDLLVEMPFFEEVGLDQSEIYGY